MDRLFVACALGFAIVGLGLGVYMGASHNHSQMVTHAHILLVGFVLSFVYGICHKLWVDCQGLIGKVQFLMHLLGTLVMVIGLFLLYGGRASPESLEPFLAVSSVVVFLAMILMKIMFIKFAK